MRSKLLEYGEGHINTYSTKNLRLEDVYTTEIVSDCFFFDAWWSTFHPRRQIRIGMDVTPLNKPYLSIGVMGGDKFHSQAFMWGVRWITTNGLSVSSLTPDQFEAMMKDYLVSVEDEWKDLTGGGQ